MTRRLLATYLLLTLVVLIALELPLALGYRDHQMDQLKSGIERDAFVLSSYVSDSLLGGTQVDYATVVSNYSAATDGRVVIVNTSGDVLADSEPATAGQRNFLSRPEIADALNRQIASGTRYSTTLGTGLIYVTVPISVGDKVLGAVRVSFSTDQVDAEVRRYWLILIGAAFGTLLLAAALGVLLARWVTRPIGDLRDAATRIGEGDLSARADVDRGPPEIKDLAAAFNATAVRLEELVTAQEQFVADASHQLRTPLTALRLRLEMLELDADDDATEDIEGARNEVQRMSRMVDGLLALARAERTQSPRPGRLELNDLLRERAAAWQPLASERGVRISSEECRLKARCSADMLSQVLDNLIANALEVSPEGSTLKLHATTEDSPSGSVVALHVVDEGPGLSEEQRERAFDRFWRATNERGELGGTGLGLAIVQKLVESEGGRAELRSAPGGGLDAVVLLNT
ncbi:MAG TPA: two-component sensor histidine kinase [Acidimicrobiaceae bacterium]|nr:two-component sensor histidine kinase [Acidimicrobiaceae bacterium]